MIERCEDFRFALEARQALRIGRERLGQDLQGHLAFQSRIRGPIHLAHAADTNLADDFIWADARTSWKCHQLTWL
jgi:hypothetical protein